MKEFDEQVRSALATLTTPPSRDDFWTDLQRLLVEAADHTQPHSVQSTSVPGSRAVDVRSVPERTRRSLGLVVGLVAVFALVAAGLIWIAGRGRVEPTEPTPASVAPQPTIPLVPRESASITDPHSIDLDPWLTGAPVWPTTSGGPYLVFDMATLPAGWALDSVAGGTPIAGTGLPPTWGWHAIVTSPAGVQYAIGLSEKDILSTSSDNPTVTVRGHEGTAGANYVSWDETDDIVASVNAFDEGNHQAEAIALAEALETMYVDQLPTEQRAEIAIQKPDDSLLQLRGTISGRAWWLEVKTAPPLSTDIGVEGSSSGTGFSTPEDAPLTISDLQLSVSGVPGGVLLFGTAPSALQRVRVELSDDVTIELPVYTWTNGSAFAVPIPDGLDAAAIAYLDSSGDVLHRTLLPEFAIPTTGNTGGNQSFGDSAGTMINGSHTPYDNMPVISPAATDPDLQSRSTTADSATPGTAPPTPPTLEDLRSRPIILPTVESGGECPSTTQFSSMSADLGPMAGNGYARPVGLTFGQPLLIGSPGTAKILWALPIDVEGPVLVRGRQIDGNGAVRFIVGDAAPTEELSLTSELAAAIDKNGISTKLLDGGWYGIPTSTTFTNAGCYGFQIDSAAGTSTVVFTTIR